MGKKDRLAQFLLHHGNFPSMKEVLKVISSGKVCVNGKVVRTGVFEFRSSTRPVTVDGVLITPRKKHLYYIFNKPKGVVCQKNDLGGITSVWGYLRAHSPISPDDTSALVSVGRLDIETEGLLFMTTDGDFVHAIANPKHNVEKEYKAVVDGNFLPGHAQRLITGVDIVVRSEGKSSKHYVKARDVKILEAYHDQSEVLITITGGKKRQVRHMFSVLGYPVLSLQRVRVGPIRLGNLRSGAIRNLTQEEITQLRNL